MYKLWPVGIPIDGPTNVYCDNDSVVMNCATPECTLKKKHNAIAYYKVRESVAQGTIHKGSQWYQFSRCSHKANAWTMSKRIDTTYSILIKVFLIYDNNHFAGSDKNML